MRKNKFSSLAIGSAAAGFVLSIIFSSLGIFVSLLALALGGVALFECKKKKAAGLKLAVAAIAISLISIAIATTLIITSL